MRLYLFVPQLYTVATVNPLSLSTAVLLAEVGARRVPTAGLFASTLPPVRVTVRYAVLSCSKHSKLGGIAYPCSTIRSSIRTFQLAIMRLPAERVIVPSQNADRQSDRNSAESFLVELLLSVSGSLPKREGLLYRRGTSA